MSALRERPSLRFLGRRVVAAGLATAVLGAVAALQPPVPQASRLLPVADAAPTGAEPTEAETASAQAKATGKRVELLSRRTENSDTWANPNGSFSVDRYGSAVRILVGQDWVPTDPTLTFAADGRVVPTAATVAMSFSGGAGPMAHIAEDGRRMELSWPKPLPRPTLDGNVATYANILPDVDLQLKADVDGFSQLLVVKTPAAAAHPDLATLKLDIDTVGLSVTADTTGNLYARNPAGQAAFVSPAPMMWDSTEISAAGSGTAGTARAAAGEGPDDPFEPGPGARDALMTTRVVGQSLEITPDRDLLTAPETVYPVFIDPSWAEGKRQNWTRVSAVYKDNSYWNANDVARVGYENKTNGLSRSFFQLDTSNIKGKDVKASTFRIKNTWSWSCQARVVQLWDTTGGIHAGTNWYNQPTQKTLLDWTNESKGWKGSSDCPEGNLEFDVTHKIRQVAAAGDNSVTLGMYAANEGDTFAWKKFDPKTAVLSTEYNTAPDVPTELGTNPSNPLIGNTNISVHALINDADAGNLQANFQVWQPGQAPVVDEHISAQRGRIATLALPDAKIPTGSYQWRVRAKDQDGAYSGWSAVKSFEVDRDRPSKPPTVASPEYPNGDAGWPAVTGKARVTAGKFTFGAAGIGDVVAYRYRTSWDPQERGVNVSSVPGSSATVTITPPAVGPGYVYAYSLDRVGNRSDERAYLLYANGTGAKDRPGDLNGDGNADAWSLDPSGTLRSYLGQGNGKFGTAAYGGASLQGGLISHRGDWDNDGIEDLLVRRYDDVDKRQKLYVYPNTGYGIVRPEDAYELTVACPRHAAEAGDCQGPGTDFWHDDDTQILAVDDLTGGPRSLNGTHALADLLVREGDKLWLYYGSESRYLDEQSDPIQIGGNSWRGHTLIAPGDTTGDGIADLWVRQDDSGDVYQYVGKKTPDGRFDLGSWGESAQPVKILTGAGAATYPELSSSTDLTGDGRPDLWGRAQGNSLTVWPGKGSAQGGYTFDAPLTAGSAHTGPNLAKGVQVTATASYEADGWSRSALVDGRRDSQPDSNGWSTTTASPNSDRTESVTVDLGVRQALNSVDLYPRNDGADTGMGFPVDFTIEVSEDGTTWDSVIERTGYPKPGNTAQSFAFETANARYVKVTGTKLSTDPHGDYHLQFAELEVYGPQKLATGAFNFAKGMTVTASSSYEGSGWTLNGLVDGSNKDGWSSADNTGVSHTESVTVDLRAPRSVNWINLRPRGDGANTGAGFPVDFTVEVSPDNTTWTKVVQRTGYPRPDAAAQAFPFDTQQIRYIKVTGTKLSKDNFGNYHMQFAELEAFSDQAYDPRVPDLAVGTAVTASSSTASGPAAALVDANPSTWWSSNTYLANHAESVTVDLGASQSLNWVNLRPRNDGASTGMGFPVDFTVQLSGDGTTWGTPVVSQTGYPRPGDAGQPFWFQAQSARYIKVTGTKLSQDNFGRYQMQLAALEASGGRYLMSSAVNLAKGAPVTSTSSYEADGFSRSNIVDGKRDSTAASQGFSSNDNTGANHTESVTVDLGTRQSVNWVSLYPRTGTPESTGYSFPVDFTIEVSENNTTWTKVAQRTGYPRPGNAVQPFPFNNRNARYIRVNATKLAVPGDYRLQLAEFEVYGQKAFNSAQPNLALGAAVTASSSYVDATWSPGGLVDNNTATGWSSSSDTGATHTEHVTADLGTLQSLNWITLRPRTDGGNAGNGFPVDFTIEVSPDGTTWTKVAQRTSYPKPDSSPQHFLFEPRPSRFVRITGTKLSTDSRGEYHMQFSELGAYSGKSLPRASRNVAKGSAVTASSSYTGPGWTVAALTDGNPSALPGLQGWSSDNTLTANHQEWAKVDLGAALPVGWINLYPRNDAAADTGSGFPVDFAVEVSQDGTTWTKVAQRTGYPKPGNAVQQFPFPTQNTRYIRVTGTNLSKDSSGHYRMQFAELEAYDPSTS
ncbi:discoidin domain-containing protein [Streptomyces zaomyceticus]|uniref:discoidin domain-containing protein n=1 Tax=Streptomyces zaomyceticus TaxID=68286 RepID=UPI00324630D4